MISRSLRFLVVFLASLSWILLPDGSVAGQGLPDPSYAGAYRTFLPLAPTCDIPARPIGEAVAPPLIGVEYFRYVQTWRLPLDTSTFSHRWTSPLGATYLVTAFPTTAGRDLPCGLHTLASELSSVLNPPAGLWKVETIRNGDRVIYHAEFVYDGQRTVILKG